MNSHLRPTTPAWQASKAALVALAASGAILLALPGCSGELREGPQVAGWSSVDPAQRHPILVSQQPQRMDIRVSRNAAGLTPAQREDVLEFAHRSRASDAGNSRLVIAAPSGSSNEVAAMNAVGEIRHILSENGFPASSIAVEAYHDGIDRSPPVRVSYLRYIAEAPECGAWPTNLARDYYNLPYPNFGCATQRNFAAQIANPADLLGPRTESDRPSERRDTVWKDYVAGKHTGAEKPNDLRDKIDVRAESKAN